MRRISQNKKTIIYILLVATFTVSSYIFDQAAIRIEDSIRNKSIIIENKKANQKKLGSISSQLGIIDIELVGLLSLNLKNINFWIKNYLLITRYDLNSIENKKFFRDSEESLYQIKVRMLSSYRDITRQSIEIADKLDEVYNWNSKLFPQYMIIENGEDVYDGVFYDFYNHEQIFNNNLNKFINKNFKKYDIQIVNVANTANTLNTFHLDNWYDLHQLTLLIIKNLDNLGNEINKNVTYIDDLKEKNETLLYSEIDILKNLSNKKNSFILLSIFSQILSLLFLLFLFRCLIFGSTNKVG